MTSRSLVPEAAEAPTAARKGWRSGGLGLLRRAGILILVLGFVIGVWEWLVRALELPTLLLPSPTDVWASAQLHLESLMRHGAVTFGATLLAFALSAVIGVLIAVLMVQWERVRRMIFPVIVALQAAPKIALAPLLIIYVGFGTKTAVIVGVLIAVFPVIVNTAVGLDTVEPELIQLARTMRSGRAALFLRIRLPFALPHIVSGLKTAIVLAVVGVVVGEFTGSNAGLGFLMLTASATFDTPFVFASVIFLTAGSLVLFYLLQALERRFTWYSLDLADVEQMEWRG